MIYGLAFDIIPKVTRTLVDLDDAALARAAARLGTSSKVETVNRALQLAAGMSDDESRRRFDELLDVIGERLEETDVRKEAWR
jgi:Arc/MetJ family transcription regulator